MTEQTNQEVKLGTENMPDTLFDEAKTTPEEKSGQTLTVKYNGESREISLEEAVVLAQKGMNYDHVVAERDSKYKRELDVLERYAAMSGMSRDEYVRHLEAEEKMSGNAERGDGMSELYSVYPELRGNGVPDSVMQAVQAGENPLSAYQQHRIHELNRELEYERQARSVRERAIGSLRGDALRTERDAFLEGFNL